MSDIAQREGFTAVGRSMVEEDRLILTSVGVDIGSSTSHLLFSRLELERGTTRYVTTRREVLHRSEILLTPYLDDMTIDGVALGRFIEEQYRATGISRSQVDTGALIMTGVALRRRNAAAIADLFAQEAGRFVAVSAGDNLEATMAAHGSGAVAQSETLGAVMNIDIGGGTTKVVVCRGGRTTELMAMDVGARLVAYDEGGVVTRLEKPGREIARRVGVDLTVGVRVSDATLRTMARFMIDELLAEISVGGTSKGSALLRTAPLSDRGGIRAVTVSGGVSEFLHARAERTFGDLGPLLAEELRARLAELGAPLVNTPSGIRATVIGASQHTIQVSGSTIYFSPADVVPVRNIPVVMPPFPWHAGNFEAAQVVEAVRDALARFDLLGARTPVAIAARWEGSASFARISAFCAGALEGMRAHVAAGHPLILVFDSDVGGLLGLHFRDELDLQIPIISIDGIDLREFDYIDVGGLIPSSGAVPVVIKSLVFSSTVP